MARKLRVEYPGALYHVMNRGDHREAIYRMEATKTGQSTVTAHFNFSALSGNVTVEDSSPNAVLAVQYVAANPIGVGPWTYQWLNYNTVTGNYDPINDVPNGSSSRQYTVQGVNCAKQGTYQIKASDNCAGSGSFTPTADVDLWVNGCPP